MGNHHSHKRKSKIRKPSDQQEESVHNGGREISQNSYDQQQIAKLRQELDQDPQTFVLNNLLMSVVFFENFEREKKNLLEERTTLEKELNPTLLREQKIECIIPDLVFHHVNKNVHFTLKPIDGITKIDPLVPRRMFVINDSIEVVESSNTPQYYGIDKPNYQVQMEESDKVGYVKLKKLQNDDKAVIREPRPGTSRQISEEEIYEYTTITALNTPKPLEVDKEARRDTLPKTCLVGRKLPKYEERNSSTDDSDADEDPSKKREELFENVTYISSKIFMEHFQSTVFPNGLAQALGFTGEYISDARYIPGKVFCTLEDSDTDAPIPCEVVPSVAIPWPSRLTFEFHMRSERPTMYDKFDNKYLWPLETHIKEISAQDCVLIPKGFTPKRGTNPDTEIEWEVAFPKAERFLDIHMSHTQTRVFLFLLTIFRTYIEPITKHNGLLVEHIRTQMYWECESNPRDWPEHRLGAKFIQILQHFEQRLSVAHIPDFFIKKKNVLENTPNKYINHAQKVFHNILQSPVSYFMAALMRVTYVNPKFYPVLDVPELHGIMSKTSKELFDKINASIGRTIPPNYSQPKRRYREEHKEKLSKTLRWRMKQEKRNRELFFKKQHAKAKENLSNAHHKESELYEVNYGWVGEQFDIIKKRELLLFFISHFIEIARKSRRFVASKQALFYLKQAFYLNSILEHFGSPKEAEDFAISIRKEEEICQRLSISDSFDTAPTTPNRNSIRHNNLTQQVKSNNINLNNLSNNWGSGFTKKSASNLKKSTSVKRTKSIENKVAFSERVEARSS